MKLSSIEYVEFEKEDKFWELEKIEFQNINLIVGRNSVGKSRTLNVINGLSNILSGIVKVHDSGTYKVVFSDGSIDYRYEFSFAERRVKREYLTEKKQGKSGAPRVLVERDGSEVGRIRRLTGRKSKLEDFQAPDDQVVVFSRQDKINYPYFSSFVNWGLSTFHIRFGIGENRDLSIVGDNREKDLNPKKTDAMTAVFKAGLERFGDKFTQQLIKDLNDSGYQVDEVGLESPSGVSIRDQYGVPLQALGVYLRERGVSCNIGSLHMSHGLLRVFSLLVQINYRMMALEPSCFIVDDIGEGLDYDRSCSIIRVLMNKCTDSHIQLFMSTNDRFVMNEVPIDYWVVLDRDGSKVKAKTYGTHREEFDRFRFKGLANFEFFSENYNFLSS